jgi:hypothetical protein
LQAVWGLILRAGAESGVGEQGDGGRSSAPAERRRAPVSRLELYRPALIAALIGTLLSLAGAFAVGQWENRLARTEFEGLAENQAITIQNGINEYVGRLITLRTLFESANEDITRSEYETFSQRLFQGHPGLLRVSWLSDQDFHRRRCGAARGRIFPGLFLHRAENLHRLRAGLLDLPGASRRARTRARR